ncbi:uncharacterized protein [Zea mays]|uniref:Uncharacterized protein n=1 Tax=Zea mays TaxID=4577 RepID=A0A804QDE4_MAIZE|nr:uncharacterized protein LOC100276809 isoform X1 [Zea mays]|eukprot:XP_020396008.1 uncharacterized protein LOC100276809 isoform X1 [Zea mays]
MKLFAFVRRARRPPPTAPDDDTATAAAAATTEKRRRRLSSSSSSGSAWKPTLGAISEDAAMTSAPVAQAKAAAAPARAKARSPRRATRAAGYDDFRTSFGRRSQTLKVDEAGDPVRRASGHPQQRHKPVLLLLLLHEHD